MDMDMVYENVDDFRTQTDVITNTTVKTRQKPRQSTGEHVRMRIYRSVTVSLVLLCVLLLTAVIVLCVLIYTNNQHFNIKTKNITEERDQLLTKYTNITEERDQLLTKYTNITEERKQLLTTYTNITKERDQLLTNNTNLRKERDQLQTKYTNITGEIDTLIAKNTNITKLSEQLNQEKNELQKRLNERWIQYRFSIYLISSEKKNWTESRRYCRERGADLIIINNKEEQDFVQNISATEYNWIGLSDIDEEGKWKWVDGSTLSYSSWGPDEPGGGTRENCTLIRSTGWADFRCSNAYKCICEKNI